MKDLIEALTIFSKYANLESPTICEHDIMIIVDITHDEVDPADRAKLLDIGFDWSEGEGYWYSDRFGSA